MSWGRVLSYNGGRLGSGRTVGTRRLYLARNPPPPGGRGKADVLTPGLAGRGALRGPSSQQGPAPRPSGPQPPQQSSGLLQPGWEGAEKELRPRLG